LIDNQDFNRIKEQMLSTMNDTLISEFTGRFLTNSKCELDLPEQKFEFQIEDVLTQLEQQPLIRMGGLRCLYFENSYEQGIVYINGEQVILPHTLVSLIPRLCNLQELTNEVLADYLGNSDFQLLITDWVNSGYWYFDA
jgi:50S ribosomal protein L16 3-hydroxylase